MPSKREAQRSNQPSVRKAGDSNVIFNSAATIFPRGTVGSTSAGNPPNTGRPSTMPRDVPGSMPSNRMFPRLRAFADGLTPHPAEKMENTWHDGVVGRFTGNHGDRRTPHLIPNPWKPTGFTGSKNGPNASTAV